MFPGSATRVSCFSPEGESVAKVSARHTHLGRLPAVNSLGVLQRAIPAFGLLAEKQAWAFFAFNFNLQEKC